MSPESLIDRSLMPVLINKPCFCIRCMLIVMKLKAVIDTLALANQEFNKNPPVDYIVNLINVLFSLILYMI